MKQSDSELLQRYVAEKAEPAFAELVRRHIDLVFSAALRLAGGDRPLAEDVTQDVFTDLARKAARLTSHTSLVGWLYTSTRYCARDARRSDRRRQMREQQAFAMNQLLQPEPSLDWEQLRPLLDDAVHALNESDRQAVLLRFFNRLPLAEVGARLAVSENTARMRVDRALDKLRGHLQKRGFTSTAAVLAAMLSNYAVEAAPMGLAATVTSAAVAAGATAAGGLAALIGLKGLLAATAIVAILVAAPDGAPIAAASVAYDWMSYRMPLRPQDFPNSPVVEQKSRSGTPVQAQDYPDLPAAQVNFNEKTGPDGRLEWTNAPSGEVMLRVSAPGFTEIHDAPARADGGEHVITLTKGTLVAGTVRDDSTGAAIPRFRVVLGWPEIQPQFLGRGNFGSITNVHWIQRGARQPHEFSEGTYSQDLSGPLIIGGDNPGYVLKFEAVDYEPFVSRIFQEGEGEVHLDVSLHPSRWTVITVLQPNGLPAAGADVGLVSPGAQLKLGQGHFVHSPLSTAVLKTEMDGRFHLAADPNVRRIIIACDDGCLSTTPESLQTNPTVRLEPWGSIEGTCVADGKPVAGVKYKLALEDESFGTVMCGWTPNSYEVESDAQGHFTIQRAPPGNDKLLRITTEVGPNGPTSSLPGVSFSIGPDGKRTEVKEREGTTPVTVSPGQTATITLTPDLNPPKRDHAFWDGN